MNHILNICLAWSIFVHVLSEKGVFSSPATTSHVSFDNRSKVSTAEKKPHTISQQWIIIWTFPLLWSIRVQLHVLSEKGYLSSAPTPHEFLSPQGDQIKVDETKTTVNVIRRKWTQLDRTQTLVIFATHNRETHHKVKSLQSLNRCVPV